MSVLVGFGLLLIVIGFVRANRNCPPPKVSYKFIPRTFVEEQENPTSVSDLFAPMFYENALHAGGYKFLPPANLQQNVRQNKFFVTQY